MPPASIYLDNNSTTPLDPRVGEAMIRAWRDCGANPASQHGPGRRARRMLEAARDEIASLLGAKTGGMDADQVIFTSGGTEANNLALLGLAGTKPGSGESRLSPAQIYVSPIEHPSIAEASQALARGGCTVEKLPVTSAGVVLASRPPGETWAAGEAAISPLAPGERGAGGEGGLASLMLANNETGVIQPVAEFAAMFRERGTLVHTDAVQAVGKIAVHFRDLGVDALSVAPHKFHGPLGIGALVLRNGLKPTPMLFGGAQQGGLRPGTENVALAVGFCEALRLAVAELPLRASLMADRRDDLERRLTAEFPDMVVIGQAAPRLPNTSCLAFPGVDRQQLILALDLAGVACSTGSACASGSSQPSPTLLAMGLPAAIVESAIRLSVGVQTTADEVAEAAGRIIKTVKHLRCLK